MSIQVELLIIGNEILSGHTLDTNSQWLAEQLLQMGLFVQQITVIRDDVKTIGSAIRQSCSRKIDLLLVSGGLGPTFDDRTSEGLAHAANTELQQDQTALRMVEKRYAALLNQGLVKNAIITPARQKMAQLPFGAEPLQNNVGTAPGIYLHIGTTHIYCLPGVPRELQVMFQSEIRPRIAKLAKHFVLEKVVQVPVLDESILAPIIDEVMAEQEGVYIKSLPKPYQTRQPLRVTITVSAEVKTKAEKKLSEIIQQLLDAVKPISQMNDRE